MHKLRPVCQNFGHVKLWQANVIRITKEIRLLKGSDKKCLVHEIAKISREEIVMSLLNQREKCQSTMPSYVTGPKP